MQKKIRVLFFQSKAYTWSTSAVHRLLLQHFDRERVEMHIACAIGPGGAQTPAYAMFAAIPDVHLRPTNFGSPIFGGASKLVMAKNLLATGLAVPGTLIGLINYVKRRQIDIIHVSENSREVSTSVFLTKMTGAKTVVQLHAKCASWMRPVALRILRQADGIIGVSAFVADSAIAIGCQPEKVYHSLNGVEPNQWDYQMDGSLIRQEFHIPPDTLIFTIVGYTLPWKGQELVLQALVQIKDRLPDFRFMIVGGDTAQPQTSHRSYLAYLQEQVRDLGLSQQVIFTGMRSDVSAILAASDLYTMPTFEEPCGLAILEAMAMKKAIVALDNGGPRECVQHGKSGLLSQPSDVRQLAENILKLANDPHLRKQMGECARQRIEEYLNPQRQANEIEQIYRRVLADVPLPDKQSIATMTKV